MRFVGLTTAINLPLSKAAELPGAAVSQLSETKRCRAALSVGQLAQGEATEQGETRTSK